MLRQQLLLWTWIWALLSLNACTQNDQVLSEAPRGCEFPACSENRRTVDEITEVIGTVKYRIDLNNYSIQLPSPEGTFDVSPVAIPCELDDNFKQEGLKVIVSGILKDSCNEFRPILGGEEFFYLVISNIKKSNQ